MKATGLTATPMAISGAADDFDDACGTHLGEHGHLAATEQAELLQTVAEEEESGRDPHRLVGVRLRFGESFQHRRFIPLI